MAILSAILNTLIVVTCLFLICLILIQRGKGGGLAGAFGGVGGSSAFGTKSGDVFTRVTIVVAFVWIMLSLILVVLYNQPRASAFDDGTTPGVSKQITPKAGEKSKVPAAGGGADAKSAAGTSAPVPSGATNPTPAGPVGVPAIPSTPSPANTK